MPALPSLALRDVHLHFDGAPAPLFRGLCLELEAGWTGIVGPNGGGKTTLLRIACGELAPDLGSVRAPGPALLCPQRVDAPPPASHDPAWWADTAILRWRAQLAVPEDALERWPTLSPGERKRAQLAWALGCGPALLAVDEPTNHLDEETRDRVMEALRAHRGVGLLVSHDRTLLDALTRRTLFVDPPDVELRPAGYSRAAALRADDRERALGLRTAARRERDRLAAEAARRRQEASRADRKRSKRSLAARDHDRRARIDLARVSGKDGRAGRLQRQLASRLERAEASLARSTVRKEPRLGIVLKGARSPRRRLLHLPEGRLVLAPGRVLSHPELEIRADARVAITGANGSGKSSLVRHLVAAAGLAAERVWLLPQETDAAAGRAVLAAVRALAPEARGRVLTAVSALGSCPDQLLGSQEPSPGELRKLVVALGLVRRPWLLALDEPTNHLDLPSIECLQAALRGHDGALLLVSHDAALRRALAGREWLLAPARDGEVVLRETTPCGPDPDAG